jgi:hypothetical protein
MENVGIFMTIWSRLRPFLIYYGHSVYFSRFGMFGPRKIWQPCFTQASTYQVHSAWLPVPVIQGGPGSHVHMYMYVCTYIH